MTLSLFGFEDKVGLNESGLTFFTIFHFIVGWLFYVLSKKLFPYISDSSLLIVWILIHTIYEVKDYYEAYELGLTEYNSIYNSLGDQIFGILGFVVATYNKNTQVTVIQLLTCLTLIILITNQDPKKFN